MPGSEFPIDYTMSEMDMVTRTKANDRSNILLILQLVLRSLLEYCMQSDHRRIPIGIQLPQMLDLTIMIERVLRHGFKANRSLLTVQSPEQALWTLICKCSHNASTDEMKEAFQEATRCVQQLPHVSSPIGRVRAFIRLSIMQKRLADYIKCIVESKNIIKEYYDECALLCCENESAALIGALVGARVIDCNMCLKEADLTNLPLTIDLTHYVKLRTMSIDDDAESKASPSDAELNLTKVLDEKNYLEELNAQLRANVANLEKRVNLMGNTTKSDHPDDHMNAVFDGTSVNTRRNDTEKQLTQLIEQVTHLELMLGEKEDACRQLESQLTDIKKVNVDLYKNLRNAEDKLKSKEKAYHELEKSVDNEKKRLLVEQKQSEQSCSVALRAQQLLEERCRNSDEKLRTKTEECDVMKGALSEMTENLEALAQAKKARAIAEKKVLDLEDMYSQLNEENFELRRQLEAERLRTSEAEHTLEEMGVHLSESKLKADDLRESVAPVLGAQWADDKEVTDCRQCNKPFTATRRKHHCRNCGSIYCAQCSTNNMALPSSSKPERVCDACYTLLLQRYSKNPI